jgi:predicted acetyltransferase
MVKLKDYGILTDGEIDVILHEKYGGDDLKGFSPEYKFKILLHGSDTVIGHINLRIGNTEKIIKYVGHIGYGIDEHYRGKKFAAKACRLVKEVAKDNGLDKIIITCNPDNYASRKICETIGARLIEIIDISETSDVYSLNETQKCRYE